MLRSSLILLASIIISCSSIASMEGASFEMDITKDKAMQLSLEYLEKEGGIISRVDMVASKHTTPRNKYVDSIENKSVADEYRKILQGKRYWAVCFYRKSLTENVEEHCSFIIFIDASNGDYLTLMNIKR